MHINLCEIAATLPRLRGLKFPTKMDVRLRRRHCSDIAPIEGTEIRLTPLSRVDEPFDCSDIAPIEGTEICHVPVS